MRERGVRRIRTYLVSASRVKQNLLVRQPEPPLVPHAVSVLFLKVAIEPARVLSAELVVGWLWGWLRWWQALEIAYAVMVVHVRSWNDSRHHRTR